MSVTVLTTAADDTASWIGLFGAALGAAATFLGVWLQQRSANKQRRADDRQAVEGLLKAIAVEVEVLFDRYEMAMAPTIRETPPGQAIRAVFPPAGDYFTVYSSNAALLGRIDNDQLRSAIVRTYTIARAILETFALNSALSVRLDDLELSNTVGANPAISAAIENLNDGLATYAESMRETDVQLSEAVSDLKRLLNERNHPRG